MTVTDIKIKKIKDRQTKLVAYATVTLAGEITVYKIKVLEKKEGEYFIAFPSRKEDDKFYNLIDVSSSLYRIINNEVISEYKRINAE